MNTRRYYVVWYICSVVVVTCNTANVVFLGIRLKMTYLLNFKHCVST